MSASFSFVLVCFVEFVASSAHFYSNVRTLITGLWVVAALLLFTAATNVSGICWNVVFGYITKISQQLLQ